MFCRLTCVLEKKMTDFLKPIKFKLHENSVSSSATIEVASLMSEISILEKRNCQMMITRNKFKFLKLNLA